MFRNNSFKTGSNSSKSTFSSKSKAPFSTGSRKSTSAFVLTVKPKAQYLVIVESPSKCAKIESFLGPQYQCIASKGHLCTIPGLKSIHPPNYDIDFEPIVSKQEHMEQMRQVISAFASSRIYLASDDDREGEAIAWHIMTLFDLPTTTSRIVFHEITQPAVLYALQHPRPINMHTVWSQRARQVLDIMVGFRVSPMLWRFIQSNPNDPLSAGRCQSVALRLVYENNQAAQQGNKVECQEEKNKFRATFHITSRLIPFHKSVSLPTKQACLDLMNEWRHISPWTLSPGPHKMRTQDPPKPLTTARLLQQFTHYPPHTVMELCQTLYQEGHITYMRTDSSRYSPEFLEQCQDYLQTHYGTSVGVSTSSSASASAWDKSSMDALSTAGTKEAHEAIRVTHLNQRTILDENKETDSRLNTLYQFIWRTTVQSCMKPAILEEHPWILNPVCAVHTLEFPRTAGWLLVGEHADYFKDWVVASGGTELFFKNLAHLRPEKMSLEEITDRPPRHYTESGLIHQMEKRGIGRPSTFAMIVRTLFERGYVKKADIPGTQTTCIDFVWLRDGDLLQEHARRIWLGREIGKILLQPMGQLVIEFLCQHFTDLLSYDYTSRMETELDLIAWSESPKETYINLCEQCDQHLKDWLKPLQKMTKQSSLRLTDSTNGEIYEYKTTKQGGYLRNFTTGVCKPMRESIQVDLHRLERGELDAADLLEFPGESDVLGVLGGRTVCFRKSTFGWFLHWNKGTDKEKDDQDTIKIPTDYLSRLHDITLEDVARWVQTKAEGKMERDPPPPPGCLRIINKVVSIRKGKYGPYAFHAEMKKCMPLKKFPGDFLKCDADEILALFKKNK